MRSVEFLKIAAFLLSINRGYVWNWNKQTLALMGLSEI